MSARSNAKERVLAAAEELRALGEKATIKAVAKRAGVSPPTAWSYLQINGSVKVAKAPKPSLLQELINRRAEITERIRPELDASAEVTQ